MKFDIVQEKKLSKLRSPVLIEGLPGIGNVGKLAADFIVEQLKPEKLYTIYSDTFSNSVFVNERNIIELPHVSLYYKKVKGPRDILILAGDFQPVEETASYHFAEEIVELFKRMEGSEIITLGGIGLSAPPEHPKIYCTGTDKATVAKYVKGTEMQSKLFGFVGPIIGAAGLIPGIAKKNGIHAVIILAETFANPMYLGVRGARKIVQVLNDKLTLGIDMRKIDRNISEIDRQLKILPQKEPKLKPELIGKMQKSQRDINYIG
ncbi:MAG: PAC2 family protein [Candidatus Woesearchaeota archaeon]